MVGLPRSSGRWMDPSVLSKQILILPFVVPTRPMRTHFRSFLKIPTLRGVQHNNRTAERRSSNKGGGNINDPPGPCRLRILKFPKCLTSTWQSSFSFRYKISPYTASGMFYVGYKYLRIRATIEQRSSNFSDESRCSVGVI